MGTAKWRLAFWRYNLKIWARKREGERRSDLNDTNIRLGRPGPAGLAGGRSQRIFFYNFRLSCGCVPDVLRVGFFLDSFSVVGRRHVDMWTELDTNDGRVVCAQRCLRRRFGGFLYTRLLQVQLTRTGFPAGGFHAFRVGYFFVEGKVRLKEKD